MIAATERESYLLIESISIKRKWTEAGIHFAEGAVGRKEVAVVISGPGKVNAAHATALAISGLSPTGVLNFGIGGGLPGSGLQLLEITLADSEHYADEGVFTERGFMDLSFLRLPLIRSGGKEYYNSFPITSSLRARLRSALKDAGIPFREGPFITVSTVTGTDERARLLRRRYRAVCENMEGAAVAHVCLMHGVDFAELRCISNFAGRRDRRKWKTEEAARRLQECILKVAGTI